jgi:microcystin-dependent protein
MGILWLHSNSTIFNAAGTRAAGAKLYFFESGTTTPRTTYSDAALTTPRTHPVICDGYGRAPAIFLDFDDYRERVQTSGGVTIWDTDGIPNAAPFEASQAVDPNTLLQPGQFIFELIDGTRAGFVRANGRTIGSAASVANERANADTLNLYTYLYNALSNAVCPVSGGRGANAGADFAANKTLTLPDLRGSVPCGLDTMGNSAGSRFDASVPFSVGNATTPGSAAGQNHHSLTTAQVPSHAHTFSATTGSSGSHSHTATTSSAGSHAHSGATDTENIIHVHGGVVTGGSTAGISTTPGAQTVLVSLTTGNTSGPNTGHSHNFTTSGDGSHQHTLTTSTDGAHTHSVSGTSDPTGGGAAHNNLPRALLGTWYIKL